MTPRRVALFFRGDDPQAAVRNALQESGILARIGATTRVAVKPNLTYPYHRPGVTTSPGFVRDTVRVLRDYTSHIAVVESDGGYGAWSAPEAFRGHGLPSLVTEFGIELINLSEEPSQLITFQRRGRSRQLPLPTRLLHATDVFITLPVPKVHSVTGVTLAYKNQWGCIPDRMRLRLHHVFEDGIVAINRALHPMVLADGTYFLDRTGPMEGEAVRMDLVIGATDPGAFDRFVSELMGIPWSRIPHLRRAVALGDMPATLDTVSVNVSPAVVRTRRFRLQRTPRSWIALAGFKSRFMTWLGYESWFGRVVLHGILYAIVGPPVRTHPETMGHEHPRH